MKHQLSTNSNSILNAGTFIANKMNKPDVSPYLAHFTSQKFPKGYKSNNNPTNQFKYMSAEKRLISILQGKKILSSQVPWVGNHKAVCLTECPWTSLITHTKQYSSYGVGFKKEFVFAKGGGPVYYVRADMFNNQKWDQSVLPFVTPFWPEYVPAALKTTVSMTKCDYTHEREWRVADDLGFEYDDIEFVVLPDYKAMAQFPKQLKDDIGRDKFLLMENYKKIEELWPVHKL